MMEHTDKKADFQLGVSIFVLLAFFTVAEYLIATNFNSTFLLIVIALAKAGLVMYYYMHIRKLLVNDSDADRKSLAYKTASNRLGLWLFLLSDSFVFSGLLVIRFGLLGLSHPDLNQLLGLGITSMLLVSSFFMNRAEMAIAHGDKKTFIYSLIITIALGVLFLAGVIGVEWQEAHFGPADGPQGAVFYVMTGFHAFHVFTGVVFLAIVLRNGLKNLYSAEKHWAVEASAVYWHFIDVVWIIFYPVLYLLGDVF